MLMVASAVERHACAAGLPAESAWSASDHVAVRLSDGRWSYDEISAFAKLIGTTKIDFEYTEGWGGTDVTPGTTGSCYMLVRWETVDA